MCTRVVQPVRAPEDLTLVLARPSGAGALYGLLRRVLGARSAPDRGPENPEPEGFWAGSGAARQLFVWRHALAPVLDRRLRQPQPHRRGTPVVTPRHHTSTAMDQQQGKGSQAGKRPQGGIRAFFVPGAGGSAAPPRRKLIACLELPTASATASV